MKLKFYFAYASHDRMDDKFAIVVFSAENSVALVPESWLVGNEKSYWPPYVSMSRCDKAAKNKEVPNDKWVVHPIRLLDMKGIFQL